MTARATPSPPSHTGAPARPATDRRIAARRKQVAARRVRRRRRQVVWGLVVLLVLIGVAELARSSLFALGQVRVRGTADPTLAAVVVAQSGVHPGEPYLRLDLGAIRRRLEALPRVAHADVRRAYPSDLLLVVTERQPVASVAAAGGFWVVSADGVVLDRVPARPTGLLFVAQVPLPADVHPGVRLPPDGPLANARRALAGLSPELARQVARVSAPTVDALTFSLRSGVQVLYGPAAQQRRKDAATLVVLRQAAKEGTPLARVDVRVPERPVVAPKGNPGGG